ncbi:MAG: 2-oxoglutarate dehydrogenase complex dihydrolipoyllysine-residue succinyltransferase [Acidobacteria bacterium]|nr:2-oxoglutarate dehydrogenase complex dihydrolipoyllysine-residue succinyltransferase [Acidobacteriota bacterium]
MAVELKVPQSGESITEVQIGQWRKSEGDYVDVDEVLVEIETDKAAIELPAPSSGILKKILKKNGEEAAVGDVIGLLEEGAAPADGAKPKAEAAKPAPKAAEKPAEKPAAAPAAKAETKTAADGAPRVMPSAQRVLAQGGVDAASVEGSGPGGRVLKEDAQRAVAEAPAAPAPAAPAPPPAPRAPEPPSAPPVASDEPGREEEVVAMTPMRKIIAKNLVNAQQNAALLTTFNEVDMTAVMEMRGHFKDAFLKKHGVKLGFMSFFVRASVEALKAIPAVNARIDGNHIVYRKYHDIGIAVGGGRGLVVPILRNAERLSFAEIEAKIADFAERAQKNKIELSELQGGTFTISNGGIYGSMLSTPIVNPPQSGILGMHNIQERAVVIDGQIVARPMMYLALTYDHRLVDGREAVTFLRHIKDVLERPERLLLEI